jgi:hypothetical protein
MTVQELAIWLAVIAFMAGLGTFIERHYKDKWPKFIDRIRCVLITAYVFIDEFPKRSFVRKLVGFIGKSNKAVDALMRSKYWRFLEKASAIAAAVWIPTAIILNVIGFVQFEREPLFGEFGWHKIWGGLSMLLVSLVIYLFLIPLGVLIVLSLPVLLFPSMWVGSLAPLVRPIARVMVMVTKHVLEKVSDPRHNPFGYAGALLGLIALAGKVIYEIWRYKSSGH